MKRDITIHNTMNILLVDDRPENLLALESILDDMNCTLFNALSGLEALGLLLKYNFALALVDVQMPDMNGFELAELIRGRQDTRHLPIIFVTAISKEQRHVFKGYDVGAVDYLFKPLEPEILRHKVNVFLELYSQRQLLTKQALELKARTQELEMEILERQQVEEALIGYRDHLETLVEMRTIELTDANQHLRQEIAERKRVEEALRHAKEIAEQANQSKSAFLANMSHEVRTPLNHIIGFTELVVDQHFGELNEVQEEYLNDVLYSSKHLLSLINDILDLSKVEAGKLGLHPSEIYLETLLEHSLIMIKEKALKHKITLRTDIEEIPESIIADERKLKQILYNLLSNAVKFTPAGGSICLSAKRIAAPELQGADFFEHAAYHVAGDVLEISVKDTGIGLKSEDLECVFQPFEQVESLTHRKAQGTGLGLSLTKGLVALHGGRIWVESDGEGKGSTFTFVLPI